jgi:hypothetical protein
MPAPSIINVVYALSPRNYSAPGDTAGRVATGVAEIFADKAAADFETRAEDSPGVVYSEVTRVDAPGWSERR